MKKTVLITGCSSGIGRALAGEFHRCGHRVYATARRIETLQPLAARGMKTAQLDVNDAGSIQALQGLLRDEKVKLDILVNNAGYGVMGPLAELPLSELRRQFETNVFSNIALIQALLPNLINAGGARIVNISSVSGVMPTPFAGAYCASKAAVNALSDTLRIELAPFGIRVITVQPGGIQSQFGENASKSVEGFGGGSSLYKPMQDAIAARAAASQENAMPAEEFARRLTAAVLAKEPAPLIRLGHRSTLMPLLKRWLPVRTLDRILSRKFGLIRAAS